MRRRAVPVPPEMPARLRAFDPAEWGAERDAPVAELYAARRRYTAAWLDWCHEHDVDWLDVVRQRVNDRRWGVGLPPIRYGD